MMENQCQRIRDRRGKVQPGCRDDRIILEGEVQWLIEGSSEEIRQIRKALTGVSEELTETLLLVDFGNCVGYFDIPFLGKLEVVSGKWDHSHDDRMLAELMATASALPFATDTPSALPYDRSIAADLDVLYHAFVYLRRILSPNTVLPDRLIPVLELILRDPHRRTNRSRRMVPLEMASNVDARTILSLVVRATELDPVSPSIRARVPLAEALSGHLPRRVDQVVIETSVDTPENRFVKVFLQAASGLIAKMREMVEKRKDAFSGRILTDCNWMDNALRPVLQHPLWSDVGPMIHFPAASTVLQRRRGYREVFQHFARLRLAARVPLAEKLVWNLLEAKNIAELYEVWCFFRVVTELKGLLGAPSQAEGPIHGATEVKIPWDLQVSWPNGTRVQYNARFSWSEPGEKHSYSVPLRPDITLYVPSGPNAGLHLLDAKFRLDQLATVMPLDDDEIESPSDVAEERQATFNRGDLYKMHTYRDAIPSAKSVWILYPGTESRFFPVDGPHLNSLHRAVLDKWIGVGAIPLVPLAAPTSELATVLSSILALEGSAGS